MGTGLRSSVAADSPAAAWIYPLAASAAMLVPVNLWDLALERELTSAAIRQVCREHGVQPLECEVVRARANIFGALVRGHWASLFIKTVFITSYLGAPVALSAAMAAWVSHLTRRIVQRHLAQQPRLDTLTEEQARAHLLDILRLPTGR